MSGEAAASEGVPHGVAEAPTVANTAAPPTRTINVRILSPAFERTPAGVHIDSLSVDATVGLLKQRIRDRAVLHYPDVPCPPDRQRLIYHGHVLANDADTLANVFGAAQIQQESDFTIHLVIRPASSAVPAAAAAAAAAVPLPQSRHHSPLPPGLPARGTPPPPAHGGAGQHPPLPPGPHDPFTFANAEPQLPVMMPQMAGLPGMQTFANFFPQNIQHYPVHPRNIHGAPIGTPTNPHGAPAGTPANPPTPTTHPQPDLPAHSDQAQTLADSPAPPGQARTVTGPNGTRYTVRVNTSTFAIHPPGHHVQGAHPQPPQLPPHHHHHHHHVHPHANPQAVPNMPFQNLPHHFVPPGVFHPFGMPPNMQHPGAVNANSTAPPPGDVNIDEAFDNPVTASDVRELAELTSQFALLMQAEAGISDQARQAAQTLRQNTDAIATRLRESTARAAAANTRPFAAATSRNITSSPAQPASAQHFDATAATVYLLSSPAGPHAVLFAPQGTFAGHPAHSVPLHAPIPQPSGPFGQPFGTIPHNAPATTTHPGPNEAPPEPAQPDPAGVAQPLPGEREVRDLVQQFNIERQNQPVDMLAAWQPLLAQFWLLFRVMLFAYFFFPTDQGWYRPAAMAVLCLGFWLLNGEGFGRGVRDAVRGWWEGVVGVPAQPADQPRQGAEAQGQAAPQQQQQQQEQQLHWLRQTFRPVERALALFLASLWPGIGERTVAARRAEEERQRREEQDETQRREAAQAAAADVAREPSTPAQESNAGEPPSAIAEPAAPTNAAVATGTDVGAGDELRERKAAPAQHVAVEGETGPEPLARVAAEQ